MMSCPQKFAESVLLSAHELLRRQRAEYRTARTLRADSDSAFSYFRVLSRKDREVVFSSACPL